MAGLTCAHELADRGYGSVLIDKAPFLGGHAVKLVCKATSVCQNCGACLVAEAIRETQKLNLINKILSARIERLLKDGSYFEALVVQEPLRILPDQCNACGQCFRVCPVPGAICLSPLICTPYIIRDVCSRHLGNACSACADVCPRSAVQLSASESELLVKSQAVVIATGFTPFNPAQKPRLGYGRITGVLTALELEELLRNEQFDWTPNGHPITRVAFIQCVGSRDSHLGRNYCSQVCCAYALRMARLLRAKQPGLDITVFYMDIQNFERDFEARLREAENEVNLCRAIPSEARPGIEGRVELLYHNNQGSNVWDSFDLVVLSIGMSPPDSIPALDFVVRNADGFFEVAEDDSVFVVGASGGPKSITESIRQAAAAAERVAFHLERVG